MGKRLAAGFLTEATKTLDAKFTQLYTRRPTKTSTAAGSPRRPTLQPNPTLSHRGDRDAPPTACAKRDPHVTFTGPASSSAPRPRATGVCRRRQSIKPRTPTFTRAQPVLHGQVIADPPDGGSGGFTACGRRRALFLSAPHPVQRVQAVEAWARTTAPCLSPRRAPPPLGQGRQPRSARRPRGAS